MNERWLEYRFSATKRADGNSEDSINSVKGYFIKKGFFYDNNITHSDGKMNFDYISSSPVNCWDLIKALGEEGFKIEKIFGDVQYRGGHAVIKNVRIDLDKLEKLAELERPFEARPSRTLEIAA